MKTELTNTLTDYKNTLTEVQNSQKQLRLTFQSQASKQEATEKNILEIEKAIQVIIDSAKLITELKIQKFHDAHHKPKDFEHFVSGSSMITPLLAS